MTSLGDRVPVTTSLHEEPKKDPYKGCSIGCLTILFVPFVVVAYGWLLSYAWGWFVVPLGVHSIGVAQACGISLVMRVLAPRTRPVKDPDEATKTLWHLLGEMVFIETTVFLVMFASAALIHWFQG